MAEDAHTGLVRAGERHPVYAFVGRQHAAGLAVAEHDVEHAIRQACLAQAVRDHKSG